MGLGQLEFDIRVILASAIVGCVLKVKKVGKTQAAQFIYTVAVRRVFKGAKYSKLKRGRVVTIKSAVSSAACGVSLKPKATYVISGPGILANATFYIVIHIQFDNYYIA
uniref:NTR domain-containing protein n=1 Tax=Magallana gigas TaxID=29159 RepID=K1QYU4_MAGGI